MSTIFAYVPATHDGCTVLAKPDPYGMAAWNKACENMPHDDPLGECIHIPDPWLCEQCKDRASNTMTAKLMDEMEW